MFLKAPYTTSLDLTQVEANSKQHNAFFTFQGIKKISYGSDPAVICQKIGNQSFELKEKNNDLEFSIERVFDSGNKTLSSDGVSIERDSGQVTVNGVDFKHKA